MIYYPILAVILAVIIAVIVKELWK